MYDNILLWYIMIYDIQHDLCVLKFRMISHLSAVCFSSFGLLYHLKNFPFDLVHVFVSAARLKMTFLEKKWAFGCYKNHVSAGECDWRVWTLLLMNCVCAGFVPCSIRSLKCSFSTPFMLFPALSVREFFDLDLWLIVFCLLTFYSFCLG